MRITEVPLELREKLARLKITQAQLAIIFAPLCIGAAVLLFTEAWRGPGKAYWEESYVYEASECKILKHKLSFLETPRGKACRPELLIEYQWKGTNYRLWTYRRDTLLGDAYFRPRPAGEDDFGMTPEQARNRAQEVLERYPIGSRQECWIDKNDPTKAILRKWRYIGMLFTMSILGLFALTSGILSLWNLLTKLHARRLLIKRFEHDSSGWNQGVASPHDIESEVEKSGEAFFHFWSAALGTSFSSIALVAFWERKFYIGLLIAVPFTMMGLSWLWSSLKEILFRRTEKTDSGSF